MILKKINSDVYLYGGSTFLAAFIPILLVPILTNFLSPNNYAKITLVNSAVIILSAIIGWGTPQLILREYFSKESNDLASFVSSSHLIPAWICGIFSVIIALKINSINDFLGGLGNIIYTLPALAFGSVILSSNLAIIRASGNSPNYFNSIVIKTLSEFILTIVLITLFYFSWDGRIYAFTASIILTLFFTHHIVSKQVKLNFSDFNKTQLKSILIAGGPLVVEQLCTTTVNTIDRFFIANMLSMNDLGIYNVGLQVGSVIKLPTLAFILYFTPVLYDALKLDLIEKKTTVVRLTYSFLLASIALVIILYLSTGLVFKIFHENYRAGQIYVLWTGISYFFWAIYAIFQGYLVYAKKTRYLAMLGLVAVIISLAGNYILVGKFGALGASYTMVITYAFLGIGCLLLATRETQMPWINYNKKSRN